MITAAVKVTRALTAGQVGLINRYCNNDEEARDNFDVRTNEDLQWAINMYNIFERTIQVQGINSTLINRASINKTFRIQDIALQDMIWVR